jgi:alkanesulfonate monooxygenase SsuD/methylene tetrahydromethanopterin reductase-like flavin-dependent oxidoreductase (luciferase family)
MAGTPGRVIDHLGELATVADELVISILPNVPENWELFSREVLPFL